MAERKQKRRKKTAARIIRLQLECKNAYASASRCGAMQLALSNWTPKSHSHSHSHSHSILSLSLIPQASPTPKFFFFFFKIPMHLLKPKRKPHSHQPTQLPKPHSLSHHRTNARSRSMARPPPNQFRALRSVSWTRRLIPRPPNHSSLLRLTLRFGFPDYPDQRGGQAKKKEIPGRVLVGELVDKGRLRCGSHGAKRES